MSVLERDGFRAYDPQLERAIAFGSDYEDVLTQYAEGVTFTQQVAREQSAGARKKPWWNFWSRGA